jgi:hypothetical protein
MDRQEARPDAVEFNSGEASQPQRGMAQLLMSSELEPDELSPPTGSPESSTLPPETPEQHALLQHYRSRSRGRRQQRRRRLLFASGALIAGIGLLATVVSWTRHREPPPLSEVVEPAAEHLHDSTDSRAPASTTAAAEQGRSMPPREAASPPLTPSPALTSTPRGSSVGYQSRRRLTTLRRGDAKEKVFELFATRVERRNGSAVVIEGMRLRASGRSSGHAQVEVADVTIADTARGTLYWFLFGDGRLIAWGQPGEWPRATARYQVEIDYTPGSPTGSTARRQPRQ